MTTKKKSFEEQLKELEKIVSDLESGDLSLDDSLKKFEQGIDLYKNCKGVLTQAEKKIKILTENLKQEDFSE